MIESLIGLLDKMFGRLFGLLTAGRALDLEHDRALFKKADEGVNEAFLDRHLNHLYNHWCHLEDARRVGHFVDDFKLAENQFLTWSVKRTVRQAVDKLDAVDMFVRVHFFLMDGPQDTLRLYPELRDGNEEQQTIYRQRAAELTALIYPAWDAYKKFRVTVKRRLRV